jgi:N-dimethylarginine dimethylaminohydrolase
LHREIQAAGAEVSLLTPVEGLPDLVFTANAAMIFERRALISRFRHRQRQGEEPFNRRWFAEHDFEVVEVPENFSFEGAGDALFCGDTLYAGYRMRSDAGGHQEIGQMLGVRVNWSTPDITISIRVSAHYAMVQRFGTRQLSTSTASGPFVNT